MAESPHPAPRDALVPRRNRPPDGVLLVGHSWTTGRVARHLWITPAAVTAHPHLLRIDGSLCLEAAYPCLQFDGEGVRVDVAMIGMLVKRRVTDDEVCDWLVRPNPALAGTAPLVWLDVIGSLEPLLIALPEPTRPHPGGTAADDGTSEQVESWIRRGAHSQAPGRRGAPAWSDYRERSGGPDPGPAVRAAIDSLLVGRRREQGDPPEEPNWG